MQARSGSKQGGALAWHHASAGVRGEGGGRRGRRGGGQGGGGKGARGDEGARRQGGEAKEAAARGASRGQRKGAGQTGANAPPQGAGSKRKKSAAGAEPAWALPRSALCTTHVTRRSRYNHHQYDTTPARRALTGPGRVAADRGERVREERGDARLSGGGRQAAHIDAARVARRLLRRGRRGAGYGAGRGQGRGGGPAGWRAALGGVAGSKTRAAAGSLQTALDFRVLNGSPAAALTEGGRQAWDDGRDDRGQRRHARQRRHAGGRHARERRHDAAGRQHVPLRRPPPPAAALAAARARAAPVAVAAAAAAAAALPLAVAVARAAAGAVPGGGAGWG